LKHARHRSDAPREDLRREADLQDLAPKRYVSDLGPTPTRRASLGQFRTRSGFAFPDLVVDYLTLGRLNPEKSNAIVVFHALSGNARVAGTDPATGRPGWWDYHVGPGKSVDTDRFFVICANVLGGCDGTTGPSSTDPATGTPYGSRFPEIGIRDMVAAHRALLAEIGIARLHAVIGGSMGGMQAMALAFDHPGLVGKCAVAASAFAHSPMQIAFNEIARRAILADPAFAGGDYYPGPGPSAGLAVARMVGHVTYLSPESMEAKFGRRLHGSGRFEVENYLDHQGASFVRRFDANAFLALTRAIDRFDLFEDLPADRLLPGNPTEFLVLSFASDWLYPPAQSAGIARAFRSHGLRVSETTLPTAYGHDSFLIKNPPLTEILRGFLG